MADAASMAISAAVRVLASITRVAAARYTREGAAAVNIVSYGPQTRGVRVGHPGGEWGWTPIQAWMLDNNGRHPLFAHGPHGTDGWRHWYNENIRHGEQMGLITGSAEDEGADPATQTFADVYVAEKFK